MNRQSLTKRINTSIFLSLTKKNTSILRMANEHKRENKYSKSHYESNCSSI